jgi:formate/nitrite transporter FocA (FNT family)
MVGALLFGVVFARTPVLEPEMRAALDRVSEEGTRGGFLLVAYKGVFAGWLIALMAWLIGSTRSAGAQIALVWLTTAPIAAFGFKHSIAGSVEAYYRAARGTAGWWEMIGQYVVPSTLGNIVGGVILVALLNHGKAGGGGGKKG